MARVMINCPATKKPVPTMMDMDQISFDSSSLENNSFEPCPECGGAHTWNKDDAFLEGSQDTSETSN
jgi:hypothetical protein